MIMRICAVLVIMLFQVLPGGAQSKSVVQLVKKTRSAVALISVMDAFGIERGQGTGFFISGNDLITNHHVVKGAASISVQTHDSTRFDVKRIVAIDTLNDLALIRLDRYAGVHAGMLQLDEQVPELGEKVYVIGNPLGFDQTVSDGIVAGVRRIEDVKETIQFTAPISSGSSGSPLMNEDGNVIGVVRSTFSSGQNINFATPSKLIRVLDTTAVVEFTMNTKSFLGTELNLRDAIKVSDDVSGDASPPLGLNTKQYNLWLIKSFAVKNGWDSSVVESQGARLDRLAKRFAEKDLDEDRLSPIDAQQIIEQAFGKKLSADSSPSAVTSEKQLIIEASLDVAARMISMSPEVSAIGTYTHGLTDQHQEFIYLREGVQYVVVTVSDDCARDIDAVLFKETEQGWKPVASDTDPDARPLVWYQPEESGKYAIVWKLARKWKTCQDVVFGAMVLSYEE